MKQTYHSFRYDSLDWLIDSLVSECYLSDISYTHLHEIASVHGCCFASFIMHILISFLVSAVLTVRLLVIDTYLDFVSVCR